MRYFDEHNYVYHGVNSHNKDSVKKVVQSPYFLFGGTLGCLMPVRMLLELNVFSRIQSSVLNMIIGCFFSITSSRCMHRFIRIALCSELPSDLSS